MRGAQPIYLDHHSTTPVDPRVLEAMLPYFGERFGNAASRSHALGWQANEAVEEARSHVATLLGASSKEIVFTSGATESDNLAIRGVAEALEGRGKHLVTVKTEHKAVLDTCKHLEKRGFEVTYVDVDGEGRVDVGRVRDAIRADTILVSVMLANNEVGTVQPIAEIGAITRARGVLLHCDAVQGLGRMPFDVEAMNVDLASVSAHKMYGPKGVGALYVRRRQPRVSLVAQMHGGGHERGMRSGTLNVPGIVGLGEAARIAAHEREHERAHVRALRDRLWAALSRLEGCTLNGPPLDEGRHPGNLNVSFEDVEAEALMLALRDVVAVSSGSACTSASVEPSYVLRAMGIDDERAHASLRFGVGRFNTAREIDTVAERLAHEVERLRARSPVAQLRKEGIDPDTIDW
jgi:cysteine desulfurase